MFALPRALEKGKLSGDSFQYRELAWNLVDSGELKMRWRLPPDPVARPSAYRPPGYPAFLGATMWLTGDIDTLDVDDPDQPLVRTRGVHYLLQWATAALAAWLAWSLVGSLLLSLGVYAAVVLHPGLAFQASRLMSEPLSALLATAFAALLVQSVRATITQADPASSSSRGLAWWAAVGLVGALLTLTTPVFHYFAPLVVVGLLWARFHRRAPAAWTAQAIAAFVVLYSAPVGGWMARNHALFDRAFISERGGANLLLRARHNMMRSDEFMASFLLWSDCKTCRKALKRHVDPASYERLAPRAPDGLLRKAKEEAFAAYREHGPVVADAVLMDVAVAEILAHPGRHLLATVAVAHRAMYVAGCLPSILLLLSLFGVSIYAFRKERWPLFVALSPALFCFGFTAGVTHGVPRYLMPVMPMMWVGLAAATALTTAALGRWVRLIGAAPRYRLYTSLQAYRTTLTDLLARRFVDPSANQRLEAELIERLGVEHAICTARARVGIHLAMRALIEPGQEVVLSPYTIHDVVNMVVAAGGVPVFADTERETCNIDPAALEALINERTGAVMVTHLHGLACDMDRISALCRERGVPLVEDAAQAFGARVHGRSVGTFGDVGVFSFGLYKNVTSFMGGAVVTPREDIAARVRALQSDWRPQPVVPFLLEVFKGLRTDAATWPPVFRVFTYQVFRHAFLHDIAALNNQVTVERDPRLRRELPEAYRVRLSGTQARLVSAQLETVDDHALSRIAAARRYHEGLADIAAVRLPPLRQDLSHTYTYFPIQVDDRDGLLRHLMRSRRDVAAQHLKSCADLPCFAEWQRDCPAARETAASVVLLPTYPRYAEAEVEANIHAIRTFYGEEA